MRRVVLGTGWHWFYEKKGLKEGGNVSYGPLNLVGLLNENRELKVPITGN